MNIDIVVFDGHDELDVVGPYEVLCAAEMGGADLHPRRVTRVPQEIVTAAYGTQYRPEGTYEIGRAELLVVPGGRWTARSERGAWGEVQRGDWLPLLHDAHGRGTIMAAVCTGAMLLAHAGVIGSRRAATHHSAWGDLTATGATLVRDRVVDDGDVITSGGVTSGIDLALWLVEKYASREIADAVAENLEYGDRARPATTSVA
ncbi:MAG TPA: DJ-1/PfpI family protein [Chloroflexota bacterium]|nr:DJ-1/PfpI family protein [Chloroflexota bacterium]